MYYVDILSLYTDMPNMWVINDGVLYTSNGGYDKIKTPIITFREFLEDCYGVATFVEFNKLIKGIIEDEISLFPNHMKELAMTDIKNAKRGFLEAKKKGVRFEAMSSFVAKENCLTMDEMTYIISESEKLMPILLIQYKTDINMICLKMKEYQRLLKNECLKQRQVAK